VALRAAVFSRAGNLITAFGAVQRIFKDYFNAPQTASDIPFEAPHSVRCPHRTVN
jgi:hypothetical protein